MRSILNLLRPLVRYNFRYPVTILTVAVILAVISGYFATQLRVDTDIANLLPDDNPHVIALDRLRDTVGGETEMDVAIKSPDFYANKAMAEHLIELSLSLIDERTGAPFFSRVEYRKETDLLRDYALYLATPSELEDLIFFLEDQIESSRLEANPFFVDFGFDDEDEDRVDLDRFRQAYDELIPPEYPVNADSTVMLLKFYPTGSRSDLSFLRRMFAAYDVMLSELDKQAFHPEMEIRFGGRLQRHLAEIESITQDVTNSFATGISSVLLLVMMYFFIKKYVNYRKGEANRQRYVLLRHIIRMPVSVIVIGFPLVLSLTYTFALTYLVLGSLNTMTSVLFVILFGLGIDYGLHFYARYLEKRSSGQDVYNALINTYDTTGSAIMASALTTAAALFVLVFADFRGFSEFGFISGWGIIFAFLAMMFIMPAVITIMERFRIILVNRNIEDNTRALKQPPRRYPYSRTIFIGGLVIVGVILLNQHHLKFEYEFGVLEPEFTEYVEFRQFVGTTSSTRRNPAYILADTDEQVREILSEIRERQQQNPNTTILDVEALQERFPTTAAEEQFKLNQIAIIRELLDDPFIREEQDEDLDRIRRASKVTEPLVIDELPAFMKERFITRDGEVGRFVMIYPSVGLSDGRNSIAFKNEIASVTTSDGSTFYAASTSIAAAEMLELMQTESPYMIAATFIMIFILVNITFRSLRWSIIAMIPLLVGLAWTFGIMLIFDIKLNFYNLVVLPAILGIGNDNGVHLAARYLEEGRDSMWNVLKSTGQHISVGSITTMMGFAGLLFTTHPGLFSIGLLALIGIGMTLLSAITFLPALIQFLEDRDWIKFYDEFKRDESVLEEPPV
ncbi:MAG: MMPL family transporter [Bacteroidetes bacterium]|nr:MMPL family transporter [Bacteroidota bacterium]MCH8523443.1 MMPL family transporter [Balneolales bacterium]